MKGVAEKDLTEKDGAKKHRKIGVAVIWDADREHILIDRRLPEGDFADYWEFPGGKIEPGEDAIACIHREIREELGIEIDVEDHLLTLEHEYATVIVTLAVYHCRYRDGVPKPLACAEIRWVGLPELESYRFPEANYQIVAALQQGRSLPS